MAVSFIVRGNWSAWRKPLTCCRTLTSHNVVSSTPHHERDSNLTMLVMIGTDCTGSCKSNYNAIMTITVVLSSWVGLKDEIWLFIVPKRKPKEMSSNQIDILFLYNNTISNTFPPDFLCTMYIIWCVRNKKCYRKSVVFLSCRLICFSW